MVRTSENTLYTGQTNNLERRLLQHKDKKLGAKYLHRFDYFTLVYFETWATRGEAMRREAEIKRMAKKEKEEIVLSSNPRNYRKTVDKISDGKRNKGGGAKKNGVKKNS